MSHVVTIGTFDGVHIGHRALVQRARSLAGAAPAGRVTAMVFDPHPATVLRPQSAPGRLSSFATREHLLRAAGADAVVRLEPTPELFSRSAREFVEWLADTHRPTAMVEGIDFRFGKGREGDVALLEKLGSSLGFAVDILAPVQIALTDHLLVTASSTLVRWLLAEGRVRDAAVLLGRPYELEGLVQQGDRRGRTIGFPTANISTDFLLPSDGIYACAASLEDGRTFAGGVHIGPRATFDDPMRTVEAHLINPARDEQRIAGLPEYGWRLSLRFLSWLREPARFESVDHLVRQMKADCERAAAIVAREPGISSPVGQPIHIIPHAQEVSA